MAQHRTKKQKESTHYPFLVSWQPNEQFQARVKGESNSSGKILATTHSKAKRANLLAKDDTGPRIKKDIIKSLITVSFILILEIVVYLALHRV